MAIIRGIYIKDEALYMQAVKVAEELGYRSFSQFVSDLLKEVIISYEMMKKMKEMEEKQAMRKASAFALIKKKLFSRQSNT